MNLIKKAYIFFFYLGIFFLPFNSDLPSWVSVLGEFRSDSSPIFFLISFFFLILYSIVKGRIYIPFKSLEFQAFCVFVVTILLVSIINVFEILDYYYKQTSGIHRLIRQLISLFISGGVFFILFLNCVNAVGVERIFVKIRHIFLWSFSIVFICGILQYLLLNHNATYLKPIINIFNYLPFVEVVNDSRLGRLSSITYEPPALGSYLLTISGFMFSYIFTSKKLTRALPFLLVIILAILSKSRTALVVMTLQAVVGVVIAYKMYPKFRTIVTKALLASTVLLIIIIMINGKQFQNSIYERLDDLNFANTEFKSSGLSVSNKSRMGIQYANLQVALENPIFGVGWGQQTFKALDHYPDWAIKHNYEFKTRYLNEDVKAFPPGYNLYIRIFAETGLLGLMAFMLFLYIVYKKTIIIYRSRKEHKYITMALLISFSGYYLNWLQIDSFKVFGFWLCLSILIGINKKFKFDTN